MNTGVHEEELVLLDVQRALFEPFEQFRRHGRQLEEGQLLIGMAELGLLAGRKIAQLAELTIVVVSQNHIGSRFTDQFPYPQGIGSPCKGIPSQQQAVPPSTKDEGVEQGFQLGSTTMNIADKDGALVGQSLLLLKGPRIIAIYD